MEALEGKLTLKEKQLSALKAELNAAKKRGSITRARAALVRDEIKKLERKKEQLQGETKRTESELHILKKMENLHVQSLNEAQQEKEKLQSLIAEKEKEFRAAHDKLEEKENELRGHKMEAERVGRRLEEVDREVEERNRQIMELERDRAELRADLQSERRRVDMLLEKTISCSTPQIYNSQKVYTSHSYSYFQLL